MIILLQLRLKLSIPHFLEHLRLLLILWDPEELQHVPARLRELQRSILLDDMTDAVEHL